jgi:hypothetical protein
MEVQLLFEADCVIRDFVPVVFDAAGWPDVAQKLRTLPPLENRRAIIDAFEYLDALQSEPPNEAWAEAIEDCCFWCEAAVWSAIQDDRMSFEYYLNRAQSALLLEFRSVPIH